MKKLKTLLIFILVAGVPLAAAQDLPSKPQLFYGEVSLDNPGQGNPQGFDSGSISIRSGSNQLASMDYEDGSFGSSDLFGEKLVAEGVKEGAELSFYVNGLDTGEDVDFEPGETSRKDISVEVPNPGEPAKVSEFVKPESGRAEVEIPEAVNENRDSGIEKVSIDISDNSDSTEVNITTSPQVEENQGDVGELPDGEYHGNVQVETESDNQGGEILFKVNEVRIDEPEQVLLFHSDDGEFIETVESEYLEDRTEDRDDEYLYFRADVPGFSTYTIASDEEDPEAVVEEGARNVDVTDSFDLDASPSTDNTGIESYTWFMDNGEVLEGEQNQYSYDESGDYDVELVVQDRAGNQDSTVFTVEAEEDTSLQGVDLNQGSSDQDDEPQGDEDQQEEQQEEQSDNDSSGDTGQEDDPSEGSSGETGEQEGEGTEPGPSPPSQSNAPTGLFGQGQSGVTAVLVLVIIVLAAYIIREKDVELGDLTSRVKSLRSSDSQGQEYSFK